MKVVIPMNEERWDFLLNGWIDESLTHNELADFEAYVSENPERRQEAESLQKTVMMLRAAPELDVPTGFRARIMDRVHEANMQKTNVISMPSKSKPKLLVQHSMLAMAAACLIVFVSLASIFPQVLPGLHGLLPPVFRANSTENNGDAGVTGVDDERSPASGEPLQPLPGEGGGQIADYSALADVGAGKMDSFPRLGPHVPKVNIIHGEVAEKEPTMQVPYRWVSYQVPDLVKALSLVREVLREQDGIMEDMIEIRVDGDPVRLNLTVYFPADQFSAGMQQLNKVGNVYDSEETLYDRSREYNAISEMIDQLRIDILDREEKLAKETDPLSKEMLEEDLVNSRISLTMWEQSKARLDMGVTEISLVLK
jgi:hypothetical protein